MPLKKKFVLTSDPAVIYALSLDNCIHQPPPCPPWCVEYLYNKKSYKCRSKRKHHTPRKQS